MGGKQLQYEDAGKGMYHVAVGMEQDGEIFHHATWNGVQFENYELFISENLYLIFLYLS